MPKTRASKEISEEDDLHDNNSANPTTLSQLALLISTLQNEVVGLRKEMALAQQPATAKAVVKTEILDASNLPISLENATRKAQSDVQDIQLRDGNSPSSDDFITPNKSFYVKQAIATRELPVAATFHNAPETGQIAILAAKQTDYEKTLSTLGDIYDVVTHFLAFDTHQRKVGNKTQNIMATLEDTVLEQLGLVDHHNIVHMDRKLLETKIAEYYKPWNLSSNKELLLRVIMRIKLNTAADKSRNKQALITHQAGSIKSYILMINKYVGRLQHWLQVDLQMQKPNANLVGPDFPYSTIWQIVQKRLEQFYPEWVHIILDKVDIKGFKQWSGLAEVLMRNLDNAVNTYLANMSVQESFNRIDPTPIV